MSFWDLTAIHLISYAIFVGLRIIQAFDSIGGSCDNDLRNLYWWLHKTMRLQGKQLNPDEWPLYPTHPDTPRHTYYDCGLYTVLFCLCVAKRSSLKIVTKERIAAVHCLLLLKLINIESNLAKPLNHGPVGRAYMRLVLYPFHCDGKALQYKDPMAPPFSSYLQKAMDDKNLLPAPSNMNDSDVNLNTPSKPSEDGNKEGVVDLMTPPKSKT